MGRIRIIFLCFALALSTWAAAAVMGDDSAEVRGYEPPAISRAEGTGAPESGPKADAPGYSLGQTAPVPPPSLSESLLPPPLSRWIRWAEREWAIFTRWLARSGLWTFQ